MGMWKQKIVWKYFQNLILLVWEAHCCLALWVQRGPKSPKGPHITSVIGPPGPPEGPRFAGGGHITWTPVRAYLCSLTAKGSPRSLAIWGLGGSPYCTCTVWCNLSEYNDKFQTIYSQGSIQFVHMTTIHCNKLVHVDYNLSTKLCLTWNYSTVCSQPIHSYQQSLHKVVSNLKL